MLALIPRWGTISRVGIAAIWRYPVKAMLGERLAEVALTLAGCAGDRGWVVVDAGTGEQLASKRGPTDPRLRACRAELLDDGDPPLRVTLPNGAAVEGSDVEPALSQLLERPVRLAPFDGPPHGRFGAPAAHHDFAPVHLLTTSTLARLRAIAPGPDWDPRRFRANLLLDDDGVGPGGFTEDALLGRRLTGGEVALDIGFPTPRCVVPTRASEDLPHAPAILRSVVREHRLAIAGLGSYGCLGAYAEVAATGRLAVGDRLAVV